MLVELAGLEGGAVYLRQGRGASQMYGSSGVPYKSNFEHSTACSDSCWLLTLLRHNMSSSTREGAVYSECKLRERKLSSLKSQDTPTGKQTSCTMVGKRERRAELRQCRKFVWLEGGPSEESSLLSRVAISRTHL